MEPKLPKYPTPDELDNWARHVTQHPAPPVRRRSLRISPVRVGVGLYLLRRILRG